MFAQYLVLSVTSNSDSSGSVRQPSVIEMIASLVDAVAPHTCKAEFHTLVKPTATVGIPAAVSRAVGITESAVSMAPTFPEALAELAQWLALHTAASGATCVVASGTTDVPRLLRQQPTGDGISNAGLVGALFGAWNSVFKLHTRLAHRKAKRVDDILSNAIHSCEGRCIDHLALFQESPAAVPLTPAVVECRTATKALQALLWCGVVVDACNGDGAAEATAPPAAASTHGDGRSGSSCVIVTAAAGATPLWLHPSRALLLGNHNAAADLSVAVTSSAAVAAPCRPALLPALRRNNSRRPADDILVVERVRHTLREDEIWAVTRKLAQLLRGEESQAQGLPTTVDGFVALDHLLVHPRMHQVQRATVAHICRENLKERFTMVYGAADGQIYVRANYGHFDDGIDVGLQPIQPSDGDPMSSNGRLLGVHATNIKHWHSISRGGINRQLRPFVTSARCDTWIPNPDQLRADPMVLAAACKRAAAAHRGPVRYSASCYILVDVGAMVRDGIPVFLVANGTTFITRGVGGGIIPPSYFVLVCSSDGVLLHRGGGGGGAADTEDG